MSDDSIIDPVKYGVLWQKVREMDKKMDKLEIQLEQLVGLANQGKGGFWAGMALVSAVSSVIGYFTHFFNKN